MNGSETILEDEVTFMETNSNTNTSEYLEQEQGSIIRKVSCFSNFQVYFKFQNSLQNLNSHKKKKGNVRGAARMGTGKFSFQPKKKITTSSTVSCYFIITSCWIILFQSHKKKYSSISNSGKVVRLITGVFGKKLSSDSDTAATESMEVSFSMFHHFTFCFRMA